MSIKLMSQVWEVQSLSQPRKMLLLAVADFANDEGLSWPSVETLMRKCSFKSDSGVRRALSELCDDGWLTKTTRSGKASNGRRVQGSNYYQISLGKLLAASVEPVPRTPSKQNAEPVSGEGSYGEPSSHEGSCHEGSCDSKNGSYEPVPRTPDPSVNSKQDPSGKTSCQAEPPDDPDQRVLDHFNKVTNSGYRDGKTTMGYIRGRLAEPDYVAEDLILVVDYLTAKWLNDPKMCDYLRPKTIFGPENFPEYYDKARKWDASGRPACVDGKWIRPGDMSAVPVDVTERDAAYRRFIGSALPAKNPSQIEIQVRTEASKAGLKSAKPEFAMSRWNSIWKDVTQRQQGGKAA